MKSKLLFSTIFALVFTSCLIDVPENIDWNTDNYDPGVIIESSKHLGFPDLIYHEKDKIWLVTYRESDAHVFGTFNKINVIKSKDFKNWETCNTYAFPGWDLRDPKFSYDDVNDILYLHIHAAKEQGNLNSNYGSVRNNLYFTYNKLNKSFDMEVERIPIIQLTDIFPTDWLWRPIWRMGNMYVAGYRQNNVRFYKYANLNEVPLIFANEKGHSASETTLRFYNGKLYALIRRSTDALLGELVYSDNEADVPPTKNDVFSWKISFPELKGLGGPNMIIEDSIVYIGGRVLDENSTPRTMLYQYSLKTEELIHLETFISYGDNSYPGMVLRKDTIYGCYYSSASNYKNHQIRSFIKPI